MSAPNSIREIHARYNEGKLTPSELTEKFLEAAKASSHNAYITISEKEARAAAAKASDILKQSGGRVPQDQPLFGIPLGIKDILVTEGVRTTCASKILENYVPPYTATAVARLQAAGAISLGKLNMDEFAMGSSNENSAYGAVKHPTHPDRVPGGSSGGSATAVRAELCVAALGTDTGGSIRLPASYSGIVGLKPTYGRVSRFGLVAFASSLDQIGPMTHSAEDAAILLDAMAGHDPMDSTSAQVAKGSYAGAASRAPDFKRLRIGVPREYSLKDASPAVAQSIEKSLKWFEAQGAKLVPISLPHTQYAVAVYYVVAICEASSNLARFDGVRYGVRPPAAAQAEQLESLYKKTRALFGSEVKRRIILGTFALSSGYSEAYYRRACQVRRLIAQDFRQAFEQVDLIAGPVSTTTAFKLGEKCKDPLSMYLNDIYTIPANLAGIPAMSLPCGQDAEKLPVGLQLQAPAFAEERLLSVAAAFEKGFSRV